MRRVEENRGKYSFEMDGYGGKGYQSLRYFDTVLTISLAPEVRISAWEKVKWVWPVIAMPRVKRTLYEIGNLVKHFADTKYGSRVILRKHFRLLGAKRW